MEALCEGSRVPQTVRNRDMQSVVGAQSSIKNDTLTYAPCQTQAIRTWKTRDLKTTSLTSLWRRSIAKEAAELVSLEEVLKEQFPEEFVEYLRRFGRRMTLAELAEAKIKWQKTRGKTQRVLKEFTKKAIDRFAARLDKDLKDPEKGPILREQLRSTLRSTNRPKSETAITEDVIGRQSATAADTRYQRTRRWMHMRRRVEVTITLPKYLLEAIEGLAETVEKTTSAVIEAFAEYCLDREDIIDQLFPS